MGPQNHEAAACKLLLLLTAAACMRWLCSPDRKTVGPCMQNSLVWRSRWVLCTAQPGTERLSTLLNTRLHRAGRA